MKDNFYMDSFNRSLDWASQGVYNCSTIDANNITLANDTKGIEYVKNDICASTDMFAKINQLDELREQIKMLEKKINKSLENVRKRGSHFTSQLNDWTYEVLE